MRRGAAASIRVERSRMQPAAWNFRPDLGQGYARTHHADTITHATDAVPSLGSCPYRPMLPHLGLGSTACAVPLPCCSAERARGASTDASSTPSRAALTNTSRALPLLRDCAAAPTGWPASAAHTPNSDPQLLGPGAQPPRRHRDRSPSSATRRCRHQRELGTQLLEHWPLMPAE